MKLVEQKKINPIEKKVILIAVLVSALHLALIAYAAIQLGISVPSCVTDLKPFQAGQLIKHGNKRYEIHLLAKMWGFEPNVIRLPVGSVVDFYLTSKDVIHGFHIEKTNANLMAIPNIVNYVQVHFQRPDHFQYVCHEFCGVGHENMNGIIEVSDRMHDAEGAAFYYGCFFN